ncbi:hypothetical protein ACQ4PT_027161 [Festuca glaucescens]
MVKTGFDPATYRLNLHLHSLISSGRLAQARALFDRMAPHRSNAFSLNRMLSGYARFGQIAAAHSLFLSSPLRLRDAVTWTVMMGALAAAPGRTTDAVSLFRDMLREGVAPDRVAVSTVLNVPATSGTTASLHPFAVKLGLLRSSVVVCNTLLDAYCKHGLLSAGRRVFQETSHMDAITYNAIIMGCSKEGLHGEVLDLFADMRRAGLGATQFTFSRVLTVATGIGDLRLGRQVHALVARSISACNVFVNNSLLDLYSKCDCLGEMEKLFDEMPERDNVSYNVMIAGYAWSRCAGTVLRLFREMQLLGFDRQDLPYATLLSVAGSLPHVGIGKQIHAQLVILGLSSEDLVGNALIDMYSKCGMLDAANANFANKKDKTGVSWTAMITGHAQNGQQEEALQLFCDMRRVGLSPDRATFSIIIKASSSLAMIGLGRQLHSYLIRSGHISSVFSGSALLDMYAKCGCLDEALQTFDEMPERNSIPWNAVISAYAHYGQAKNAIKMFEGMLRYGFKPDSVTFLSVLSACSHNGLAEECMKYFELMEHEYGMSPWKEHYSVRWSTSVEELTATWSKKMMMKKATGQMTASFLFLPIPVPSSIFFLLVTATSMVMAACLSPTPPRHHRRCFWTPKLPSSSTTIYYQRPHRRISGTNTSAGLCLCCRCRSGPRHRRHPPSAGQAEYFAAQSNSRCQCIGKALLG